MGAYMARAGLIPDLVLCSSAQRTRQTLEALLSHLPVSPELLFEERIYLASRGQPRAGCNASFVHALDEMLDFDCP